MFNKEKIINKNCENQIAKIIFIPTNNWHLKMK